MCIDVPYPPEHTAGASIPLSVLSQDEVIYTELSGAPGEVLITLSVDPRISWWKGLEVNTREGHILGVLQTQDANRGPVSLSLRANDQNLDNLSICLLKAKAFGAHTAMYALPPEVPGKGIPASSQ